MNFKWLIAVAVLLAMFALVDVNAAEFEEHEQDALTGNTTELTIPELHSMIATAYCIHGITASETPTRLGICASKREWFGKTAHIYRNNNGKVGELIGSYKIEDTGSAPIRKGHVIDIWMETEGECFDFGKKLVYVIIE